MMSSLFAFSLVISIIAAVQAESPACGRSTINPSEDVTLSHEHHNSSKGDSPWMAAIYNHFEGKSWMRFCGGALISPDIVITAAHCVTNNGTPMETKDVRVGLGKLNGRFYQEENSIISTVKEIVRPERYVGMKDFFDMHIALLVLSKSVVTRDNIMPVCMDWGRTAEPKQDEVGYFGSWIGREDATIFSDALTWDTWKYVEYDNCRTMLQPDDGKFLTHDKFCATGNTDDLRYKFASGGGLTMLRNGTHYLYGIMSTFYYDLAKQNITHFQNISLFTNVLNTTHLDWIQQQRQRLLVLST